MKKELRTDNLDKIAFLLFKKGIIRNGLTTILSIEETKEGENRVLIEEPTHKDNRRCISNSTATIDEYYIIYEGDIEYTDAYELSDLTDEEFLKRRIYRFNKTKETLYIDRKKTIIDPTRKIENTRIVIDNNKIASVSKETRSYSNTPKVLDYTVPFSRPSISLGYGNNFDYIDYDDDSFVL